ncbi:MAG TPA: NADH-quinone oxidoreductase subunit NuoG [Thermoleophilaceae bacterium]|nr:NADH-quinone oxidoreductase subunit NuoG [Thermoleophilaceae bacterium]
MPRPEQRMVTFEIDGRDVTAPEGAMLVDGAKHGDVEIPVFCYEPKIGPPVGACRMCLVEIEGIPKLQTACSTPVKDGMVVTTTSDRVKSAQEAIVEFLLVNHPLDCPVCDKGGECPLQDISFGWGAGRSRMIEPKRHFKKPVELSPLVAIDRERCILCYRCVRFSQEVSEDYQLVFLERGDHTFVGTNDGAPYIGPFSGNIVELCPVGALTSTSYRFRARPWDVEDSGSICALCPSQCNIEFTVRDDARIVRVMSRHNEDVEDGWLCDKGRYGYQAVHSPERITTPMIIDGGVLREVAWERALEVAAAGLKKAGRATAALVGGETTNEEGFLLQRLMREALGSPHIDSRASGVLDPDQARVLARPDLSVPVWDIENAATILVFDTDLVEEAPIIDLRVRKARRRRGAKLVVASSRPTTLDANAEHVMRFPPGGAEAALQKLADSDHLGEGPVVIIWGERLSHGRRGKRGVAALLALARKLNLQATDGAGLIEIPRGTNARGLREVGCLPNLGPGLADVPKPGKGAEQIAAALGGKLSALILLNTDPPATGASFVVAFADHLTPGIERANVIFPAASYAEKEGTMTHPDGRLQRLRQAIGHPGEVRQPALVLAELTDRLGFTTGPGPVVSTPHVTRQIADAVPFYAGITLDEIGGRGVRWQERDAASALDAPEISEEPLKRPPTLPKGLKLGTVRSLWAGRETRHAPALRFLAPRQQAELSAEDARELGVRPGDEVIVAVNGTSVQAIARLRQAVPPGTVFLLEGELDHGAVVEVRKA